MGTRQPSWTGTDDRDFLAGVRTGLKKIYALVARSVTGISLQTADFDRLLEQGVVHAGAFAKDFRRTGPRAGAAKDIRIENRFGGTHRVLVHDLADEAGNVDVGRTRARAWRIETKQASRGFSDRLAIHQTRFKLREIGRQLCWVLGSLGTVHGFHYTNSQVSGTV